MMTTLEAMTELRDQLDSLGVAANRVTVAFDTWRRLLRWRVNGPRAPRRHSGLRVRVRVLSGKRGNG